MNDKMGQMGKRILTASLTVFVFLAIRSNCAALPVDLGAAGPGNWTVLETGSGAVTQTQAKARGGKHAASANYSLVDVSDSHEPLFYQARLDAIAASAAATGLASTSILSQMTLKRQALTLDAGVYNLTQLQMNRATLTLSGPGNFVFNISSVFALKSAQILLANGATEANVLFNYTGTNDVAFSGKRGSASVLHGIILALNAKVNMAAGLVVGEIISGQDISLSSGAWVQALARGPAQVPENSSTAILCSIACGALLLFRSLAIRNRRNSSRCRR